MSRRQKIPQTAPKLVWGTSPGGLRKDSLCLWGDFSSISAPAEQKLGRKKANRRSKIGVSGPLYSYFHQGEPPQAQYHLLLQIHTQIKKWRWWPPGIYMLQGQFPQAEYQLLRKIDTYIKKMAVVAPCYLHASGTAPAGRAPAPPADRHLNQKNGGSGPLFFTIPEARPSNV